MNTAATEANQFSPDGLTQAQLARDPFGDNAPVLTSSEDDAKLHIRFYFEPVYQEADSIKANRKIFSDTEFIEIRIPGDKQTCIARQVLQSDIQRFPQQYARFKQGLADQAVGTPLDTMPSIPASKVKEYEFFHIRTVEQLAGCADNSNAAAIMGFQTDKRAAQKFLDAAAGEAPLNELRDQLKQRDDMLAQMSERLAKLEGEKSTKSK